MKSINKLSQKLLFLSKENWLFVGLAFISLLCLVIFVDLSPKVDNNFFFSSDDPQFQSEQKISDLFNRQDGQLIISASGSIYSEVYQKKVQSLSNFLLSIEGIHSLKSISHGPSNLNDALNSPLWQRLLISEDRQSTNIIVLLDQRKSQSIIQKIDNIVSTIQAENFQIEISGFPYIVELIRRYLTRDLTVFTSLAFFILGLTIFIIFRSRRILIGSMVTCTSTCIYTLMISHAFGAQIGLLTANISTIIFVLTLSHIIFFTFNWQSIKKSTTKENAVNKAIQLTLPGSFWSMLTTLLGFISLLFVQAKPLRELGLSGSIGTVLAFVTTYTIYPSFLRVLDASYREPNEKLQEHYHRSFNLLENRHQLVMTIIFTLTLVCFPFIWRINTDPSILSYFAKNSEITQGLKYIDNNGGSSPLILVLKSKDGKTLNYNGIYREMWELQHNLEAHRSVGTVLSLPTLLSEGKRNPIGKIMASEWLIDIMESPSYDRIAQSFITKDRKHALFLLRMKETDRVLPRTDIINDIKMIVSAHNFETHLVGGVYALQGQLAQLVTSSLIFGLGRLILIFGIIAYIISRLIPISLAMTASIAIIPVVIFGGFGLLNIPMDIIASPASNIAIAVGIDAMIHMTKAYRRLKKQDYSEAEKWKQIRQIMWKPIISSMLVIGLGFGIFFCSSFPPTQRFGGSVVAGSFIAGLTALFIFPQLIQLRLKHIGAGVTHLINKLKKN